MNAPRTVVLSLLLAGVFLALGSLVQARHAGASGAGRNDRPAALAPALATDVARAQAAAALASAPAAASLLHLGL